MIVVFAFSATSIAESDLSLERKLDTLMILPSNVSSDNWHNAEAALSQDVSEGAVYQNFTPEQAAYLGREIVSPEVRTIETNDIPFNHTVDTIEVPQDSIDAEHADPSVPETDEQNQTDSHDETTVTANPDTTEAQSADDNPVSSPSEENSAQPESNSDPVSESTPTNEPSAFNTREHSDYIVTRLITHSLPLLVESIDVPLSVTEQQDTPPEHTLNSHVGQEAPAEDALQHVSPIISTDIENVLVHPKTKEDSSESALETTNDTIESQIIDDETQSNSPETAGTMIDTPSEHSLSDNKPHEDLAEPDSSLMFTGFGLPDLNSGQFIRNVQLRVSLGALAHISEGDTIPSLEFEYSFGKKWESAGIVLIDGEVSNALNGGYYLFALPRIQHASDLEKLMIRVSYNGEAHVLEHAFVDALWVEVDTETFDRSILKERLLPEGLTHLKLPTIYSLLTSDLDFTRSELPKFSLRYESQRNFAVRFVRSLFGRDLAHVADIKLTHVNTGPVYIEPKVDVTSDGLITVQLTDADKAQLRPGEYTLEIVVDEGGKQFADSFNFQWGLLAVNPDQAEYAVGDTASIALGALTRNGNTLCDAQLLLYVIDPLEYIYEVPVKQSGQCSGNNVIDVPDYSASFSPAIPGTYEMYVERLGDDGSVISHTNDTFKVVDNHPVTVKRSGPTRIFPPAPYPMQLSVTAKEAFSGILTERVPRTFIVSDTDAEVVEVGDVYELRWNVDLDAEGTQTFSYTFDAPDLSPYLYKIGGATIASPSFSYTLASSTDGSTTTQQGIQVDGPYEYTEHRSWQIASDATGNMLLFWDNASGVPTGWTCVSCTAGDPFYQRFIQGSSTYNNTGGTTTHTHSASSSLQSSSAQTTESGGSNGMAIVSHSHTFAPDIGVATNTPAYRTLRVIQYTASAGEPASIPTGAIGIFDATVPTGWTQYSAQNGSYIRGESTVGSTGGSNTQTHTLSTTTGQSTGGTTQARGAVAAQGAATTHTHSVSTTTPSVSVEPPYITVILGKLDATTTAPNGLIGMWTDSVPTNWVDVSSGGSEAFNQKFLKAESSYGSTGGAETHSHSNMSTITTGIPSGTNGGRAYVSGSGGASDTHTHTVTVTNFTTKSNLPPYVSVILGKRQGTNPVFTQLSSRWYVNISTSTTPTDPWPEGATNLAEKEGISATSTTVKDGDILRLRVNALVTNATATASSSFKLQYASTTDSCSSIVTWYYVGAATSTSEWRGVNNSGASDHATLSSGLLASTTVNESYEENGYTTAFPNNIGLAGVGEWDFVLEQNGASAGALYCFRLVESDGTALYAYNHYPQLRTNYAPDAPTLSKLFDNEKTASTTPWFEFVTSDDESEELNYQIQIDNDADFSSTVIEDDTTINEDDFLNRVQQSDKDPFTSGQLMRYSLATALSNGTTYWWRVRAKDPNGSNQWGSWATAQSFTIDTSLTASAWFQTTEEQFDTSALVGLDAIGTDQVQLITGSTTGTYTTDTIDFDSGSLGTAWDSLSWNDTETTGDIKYTIEYLNTNNEWGAIPDADLSGNSTGFDTSPVSLLGLDTDTYNDIRVVATFTNSGGSPSLQDITVSWGYRVETPTLTSPFPNEKVGTSTPSFLFSTTDPQSDSLTYQISWSTDNTFTSSTTRTSDTHVLFENTDAGGDFDPFDSGDPIRFTVQSGDALTNGATYWWRVRAKDTTGDDAYSLWTEAQSFTVDTSVVVSTWFQTTEEQFDTNTLSGTDALSTDILAVATTAAEAMLVYGEGTESAPRYRQWNGSSWGSEGTLSDIGAPVRWAVVKAGTTREEYVAATLGTDGDINVQVFSLGEWGNIQEVTAAVSDVSARGFDVAYETYSGRAFTVFCDGDADPGYYIWNGSGWAVGTSTINLTTTSNCAWVRLAADPTSNELIVLTRDAAGTYEAQVWNATTSTWGNASTQGSITETGHEGMAVEYEESGNQALIVTSDGNPARFKYNTWDGSAWGAVTNVTIGNDLEWADFAQDSGSDELALCYQDEDSDVGVYEWSGGGWVTQTELSIDANAKTDPAFACVYETTSGRDNYIMSVLSNSTSTDYQSWNNTSWTGGLNLNSIGDSSTMRLIRTGVGAVLGIFFDDANGDFLASSWNGTSWSTTTTIEGNAPVYSSPLGYPYALTPRNDGREGTVVVSPAIDFSDGVGPYWDQMSWSDSTPGTSDILYSIQYYNTASSSWEFIPDTDLPGNSIGTTTSPIDLSGLSVATYGLIRPYAELTCDTLGNCPTISDWTVTWAEGITVSGTLYQNNQTSSTTSGTVAVAVDGVLQSGKTGTVSNGSWSISNVTTFPGDIVTVFVSGANDDVEAVGITRYDGAGDITGLTMYEHHVALGSDDATTTAITNSDIGLYGNVNDEDLFHNATGTSLAICAESTCQDAELIVQSGVVYRPEGSLLTHDIEINGTLLAQGNTITVTGSWDNNATATLATSTIIFTATSTSETIDSTGSISNAFYNITFGTTTSGSATWSLPTLLDVDNNLTVSYGTLARGSTTILIAGNLVNGANGNWTGAGTTTFDGTGTKNWSDSNVTLQDVGRVVVDGTSKTVQLSGNVKARSIYIGADDILDVSTSNYDITVLGDWINTNTFTARSGEVVMSATTSNHTITAGSDAFYDLTFSGAGGSWSFSESALTVTNDFRVSTGTVTMPPTGTTTVGGSWNTVNGSFAHNNGTVYFTSSAAETIAASGTPFFNNFYILSFNGSGSWTFLDTNATTSNDIRIAQGTVTFPSGTLTVGSNFVNTAGSFTHNSGTVRFTSSGTSVIDTNASFNSLSFTGSGAWSFTDTSVTALGSFTVTGGTVTLPSNTLTLGGSLTNSATIVHNSGTVLFNSADTGETISLGNSSLYNMTFRSTTGGWTVSSHATATNNVAIATSSSFTLASGQTLAVLGTFTNSVGGASTTWTGSTLSLDAGSYSINSKNQAGDAYDTLRIRANTDISMWNSSASTYTIDSTGSLYSQDHSGNDGDLYIFGSYERTSGSEYWSYATDFDGTVLTASTSRQVDVRFASGASAGITGSRFEILGGSGATTTIDNQGSGTYTVSATTSTTTFTYYDFSNLGMTGVTLSSTGIVTSLNDGAYEPGTGGATGLRVASSTIDANPGLQIYRVNFSTTSAISATNVTQYGAAPTSFWWFRESTGNIDGEYFDNDTGDPGSVRWDDSSLVITVSGTVFSDDGVTPMGAPVCDDVTQNIKVVVNGTASTTGSCASADGTFSIPNVVIVGDPVLTIYLDTNGGAQGTVVTRTPTADITDLHIYQNRVTTRHEDVSPLTILNMATFDADNDSDIQYNAATGTLTVFSNTELHVASSTTFAPGGDVTVLGNASSTSQDGSLHIDDNATFTGSGTSTITLGGSFTLDQGATFTAASTTVVMNATTSGKTITTTATQEITFNTLEFNGAGGGWNINGDVRVLGDMDVTLGTVTGTADVTVVGGSLSGNGVLSFGSGTTTVESTNTLGGTTAWTFSNLVLGSGAVAGTTTPGGATTTILGKLTINTAHYLDGGSTVWNLAGSGNVFVESGTFLEDTTTVRYSGTAATNILSTTYYNLDLMAQGNSPTYTATGLGVMVINDLVVGGATTTTATFATSDPVLDVNGGVIITTTGTLIGSDSASFTVAGDWINDGVYTGSGGTVTFDGSGTSVLYAGSSSFSSVVINGTGSFTVAEHATTSSAFTLTNAGSFTLGSGQVLAVGGTFSNNEDGANTTWTGATLSLFSGTNYSINASTTSDTYDTLLIAADTDIRMWNSSAGIHTVHSSGSLYSQDHAGSNGDLYIFGNYPGNGGTDHWSYATDFDGSLLSSPRKVDVYFASGASATYTTGGLSVSGDGSASTTVQNQGSGTYSIRIGGNASTTWSYYELRNMDSNGLTLSGTPTVVTLSYGNIEVSQNAGSGITVGGTVITQNPAKTFTHNYFGTSTGITSAVNVTATGTTVSSWRFTNHEGEIDGEDYDVDPDDNPGYVAWDDSAALITIAGNVYANEGSSASTACDGSTPNVVLRVAGLTSYTTTCNAGSGAYTINNVAYSPGDSFVVYIDGETEKAATVSEDPISNINNMDLYENRVIVRHESADPLSIDDMAVWDSSDDADIPFTALSGSPDTLTLPSNRKLIVWTSKEFEPNGNVTITGGGGGADYDGTLELYGGSVFDATGSESHTVGGSLIAGAGATIDEETSTFTFTTTGAARTIDTNGGGLYSIVLNGSGSWTFTDTTLSIGNDFTITQGAATLPAGTTTVGGSLSVTGGSFTHSDGTMVFTSSGAETIRPGGSSFGALTINGTGSFTVNNTNATVTADLLIQDGTFTSATGTLTIGGDFINNDTFTHGGGTLRFIATSSTLVTTSGSDLYSTVFASGGSYTFTNTNVALLGSLSIQSGSVALATGTMSIGGSLQNTGGSFTHATGTVLFNSSDTGETITTGTSTLHNVSFASASGGWTLSGSATTTGNFSLTSASSFTLSSSSNLTVNGVFTNLVGGAATTWTGSTLVIRSGSGYTINTKVVGGDTYNNVVVGSSTALRSWDSAGTITMEDNSSSFYSQDHAAVSGSLYVYGNYLRTTGTDYWSYATDFDGTSLSGSERQVYVYMSSGATTTLSGGTLNIVGTNGFDTTISNQGSGTYTMDIQGGTLNAQYYSFANLDANGLQLSGNTVVSSLTEGNFTLAVSGGSLITLSSTTLNYNAGLVVSGASFATSSAITGVNVELVGTTPSAWTFTSHTGNLDGEAYDTDGGDACGSIRWDDSSCLLSQQSAYRFRNDDGGEGVPDSEWYDSNWTKRKRVTVTNADAAGYSNAAVELTVAYDSDMQSDFDDLRFTTSDGTTLTSHFIETYTASTEATVWILVPDLATSTDTELYMYYGNGGSSDGSDGHATFVAFDDFEDGNLTEYSGDTSEFTVTAAGNVYEGTYSQKASDPDNGKTDVGGMYNNSASTTVSQGQTIRYFQYINTSTGSGDESCTTFGTQGQTTNYAVCLELFGTDRLSLARNVLHRDQSGTVLASTTVTYATGWYEVEIDWRNNNTIFVTLLKDDVLVATTSATTSTYTTGGIGYTLWSYHGAWDVVTSRPLIETEPTVSFGFEQVSGGASWVAALNTAGTGIAIDETVRIRFLIENTGTDVNDQNYELEYAPKGASPSCESVSYSNYIEVPNQALCGSSDICMQTSSYITDLASSTDILGGDGTFTYGQTVESPSNNTGNISIANGEYTELEYAITPTVNVTDSAYCFRVTNEGTELDAYTRIAELGLFFAPSVTALSLNGGADITLVAGTTTTITATGTVTDYNGYSDITAATTTIYRSGVGDTCTADNNNCYIAGNSLCSFSNCSGNSCDVSCSVDFYYHADPTDIGSTYAGETWRATLTVSDQGGSTASGTAPSIDLSTLRALAIENTIDYGTLEVNADTGSYNASTSVENIGNDAIDVSIEGTDLSDGGSSAIPVDEQIFATSTFTYSACTFCSALSTTSSAYELDLSKPTSTTPAITDQIYWGIAVPFGVAGVAHQGVNTFYATGD